MYNVIFVDDDYDAAKEYAELVANFAKIKPLVCNTRDAAIEAVKQYEISVAVLDQRMPEVSGTELFSEISKLSPRTRCIMLTGEAAVEEVGDAINLGYKLYMHKSDIAQLPRAVLLEHTRYLKEGDSNLRGDPTLLGTVALWWGFSGKIEFWLQDIFVEDTQHVPLGSWKEVEQIICGEKKISSKKFERTKDLQFETSLESSLSSNSEISVKAVAEVKSALNSTLNTRLGVMSAHNTKVIMETTRELTLPPEPQDPTKLFVRKRIFCEAQIFRKIQCHIVKKLRPFNEEISAVITVLQPTDRIASKHIDILSDGRRREVDLSIR